MSQSQVNYAWWNRECWLQKTLSFLCMWGTGIAYEIWITYTLPCSSALVVGTYMAPSTFPCLKEGPGEAKRRVHMNNKHKLWHLNPKTKGAGAINYPPNNYRYFKCLPRVAKTKWPDSHVAHYCWVVADHESGTNSQRTLVNNVDLWGLSLKNKNFTSTAQLCLKKAFLTSFWEHWKTPPWAKKNNQLDSLNEVSTRKKRWEIQKFMTVLLLVLSEGEQMQDGRGGTWFGTALWALQEWRGMLSAHLARLLAMLDFAGKFTRKRVKENFSRKAKMSIAFPRNRTLERRTQVVLGRLLFPLHDGHDFSDVLTFVGSFYTWTFHFPSELYANILSERDLARREEQ